MTDSSIWDRYWQFDRIASCFDDAGAHNYDEVVSGGWRDFFGSLPAGSAILDLCTGNGAIAIMAAEASARLGRGFAVTAVDRAAIDPRRYVTRHREALAAIDFRPGTDAAALPFAERSFGAVVSQYGIEYTDLPRSAAELARVVAPEGRVRLVVHAAEGKVAEVSRRAIAEADFMLDEVRLSDAARACFVATAAAERTSPGSPEARTEARARLTAFEGALRQVGERIPAAADPANLRNAGATLLDAFNRRGTLALEELIAVADRVKIENEAHRGRLAALVASALSAEQAGDLATRLRGHGAATAATAPLHAGEALIGHVIEARF